MWVICARGFYSVVENRNRAGELLVRARVREDLEALRDLLPGVDVEETPERDYRFRVSVPHEDWALAVAELAREIDYPNFKDAVAERQGRERAHVYSGVWGTLLALQQGGRYG